MIEATCHCGAVVLAVDAAPLAVTDCNCSICRRRGALWAKYPADEVRLVRGHDATTAYVWGDRCIEFHHCAICGCSTHFVGIRPDVADRIAVNARLMPLDPQHPVKVRRFDGATSWTMVADEDVWPWPCT